MITEDEYVIDSFRDHFEVIKNRNIVIYGIGPKTELILNNFPEYNIVGLMDRNKKESQIYGKPLLSLKELLLLKIDMIVVVARIENYKPIFKRIRNFCYMHQIKVYGINGKNLFDFFGSGHITQDGAKYFELSEGDLKKQIDRHDVISFGIFDILIMRKTLFPQDVFDLVQDKICSDEIDDFNSIRTKAERESPNLNTNIYGIYDYLQKSTGISDEEKEYLLHLEMEVEKQVLVRREKMVNMLEYAVKEGKRVYLISDMYLPGVILKEILTHLGIQGFEEIFVSCDYGKNKENGLYEIFKDKVCGNSYLHIGQNDYADFCANNFGIDIFIIQSAWNMLRMSTYGRVVNFLKSVNDRSMLGLCIAKVFNNPFCMYKTFGRPRIHNIADFGYLFLGPLVTNFIIWLVNELEQGDYDDILFSARDGFLIQKLYNTVVEEMKLKDMPKGVYFQTSRKLCTSASMENEEDIEWLAQCYPEYVHLPEKMMRIRFGLSEEEILSYDEQKYSDFELVHYALAHKDKIYKTSERIRKNYLTYMKKIGLERGKKYALFDFHAAGTSEYFLSKIVPYELEGIYVCRQYEYKNKVCNIKAKSLFSNYGTYSYDSYLAGHYLFLETIFTSFAPSVESVNKVGEPIFSDEVRSAKQLKFVQEMQDAIQDYFNDYIKTLYIKTQTINKEVSDMILNLMDEEYTDEECNLFDQISLTDDMAGIKLEINRKQWSGWMMQGEI